MAKYTIRGAGPDDLDALRDVYRRSSLSNEGDRDALLAHPDALVFADDSVREQRTRVAISEGRIVGFATTQVVASVMELEDLFVDPSWMRRGIGRRLVVDAAAVARSRGFTSIEVTGNGHALEFDEATGFSVYGVTETRFGPDVRMRLDVAST